MTPFECPRCGGDVRRIHRTRVDRLVDLVVPVRRFRCTGDECGWAGRRVSRKELGERLRRHSITLLVVATGLFAYVVMRLLLGG